jgi:hypothetical protein
MEVHMRWIALLFISSLSAAGCAAEAYPGTAEEPTTLTAPPEPTAPAAATTAAGQVAPELHVPQLHALQVAAPCEFLQQCNRPVYRVTE